MAANQSSVGFCYWEFSKELAEEKEITVHDVLPEDFQRYVCIVTTLRMNYETSNQYGSEMKPSLNPSCTPFTEWKCRG